MAVEADGDYAVAWNRNLPAPAFRQDIELRTYTADGAPREPLRVIWQDLVQAQLQDLAALADGFVSAWNVDCSHPFTRLSAYGLAARPDFEFSGTAGAARSAVLYAPADP